MRRRTVVLGGAASAMLAATGARGQQLVINLGAARALGIAIPQAVLVRADRVIE